MFSLNKMEPTMSLSTKYHGILDYKQALAPDIIHLGIRLVEPDHLDFTAGQYIRLDSQPYDQKPVVSRPFSLASAPQQKNRIELIIRRTAQGVCTPWIFDHLALGQDLTFSGPLGKFKLTSGNGPILMIAGGSGMSAIWSILQDMRARKIHRPTTCFFGARTRNDLYFTRPIAEFVQACPWFTFIPALSENADNQWQGQTGLVTDVVDRLVPEASSYEAYLCGAPGMINACKPVLLAKNIRPEHVFYDPFIEQKQDRVAP
jgi:Na+-transporting NADH:ubiquinone oxidoreductase subunit F